MDEIILEVKNLKKYFFKKKGILGLNEQVLKAVDDVSFFIKKGETFGLVGESGSGKTTVGRTIIKLYDATSGEVYFNGEKVAVGEYGIKNDILRLKKGLKDNTIEIEDEIVKLIITINEQKLECKKLKNIMKKLNVRYNAELDLNKKKDIKNKLFTLSKQIDVLNEALPKQVNNLSVLKNKLKELQSKNRKDKNTKIEIEMKKEELKKAISDNIVKPKFRKKVQMIFQDPYASLNSRMTVADIISEPMKIHNLYKKKEKQRVYELLEMVGLSKEHASRYPHEFSGGQRQRIGFARALAVNPEFIICDEPISALDVSIQAQVINLLEELQEKLGLTYLFIAHDLSMVKHISKRIAVMYLGKIVEITSSQELFKNPLHPYTKALLSAVPVPSVNSTDKKEEIILEGDIPSAINPPSGCRFRTRCNVVCDRCITEEPVLREINDGHIVACHLLD